MKKVPLGKTGLMVSEIAFGGIPIQRLTMAEAVGVVRAVIDMGVNFLDTAHGYSDSEEKIGEAIKPYPRESLIIASKSPASDKKTFLEHLDLSLKRLGTDYVDIYQHHGVSTREKMNAVLGPGGAYEGMLEAIRDGKIRHAAFSSHHLPTTRLMMETGKYEVTQIPFNYVDDAAAGEIIPLARSLGMGFISMKPLGGGLLSEARLCFRYLMQIPGIVPDPGIEKIEEMREIISIYENHRGPLSATEQAEIERIRTELGDSWCHRCDYCQPCPQDIKISSVLSAKSMAKRMPYDKVTANFDVVMKKTEDCTECRDCVSRCPYDLDIPALLVKQRGAYARFRTEKVWA